MKIIKTDCLVIGSGIAGSLYAYKIASSGLKCVLISAGKLNDCNSNLAQGGIVYEPKKDFSDLIKDIQRAKKCMQNADITILGSLQWANKEIKSQKQAIDNLMQNNKNIILLSLMSPYDIKNYPKAKTVLALYGINTFSASNAASIILGAITPKGHLPISL